MILIYTSSASIYIKYDAREREKEKEIVNNVNKTKRVRLAYSIKTIMI